MRVLGFALLGLLLLPALSHGQAHTISTRLTPPERVGTFRLASIKQLEGGAGGHLRYRSAEGVELDALLQPLPDDPECDRACDSVAVDREADAFPERIPALVEQGVFDSLAVERDDTLRVEHAGAVAHGRHLRLAGPVKGRPTRLHVLLYGIGSYMVRVGAAHPPSTKSDSLVAEFAREFVRSTMQPAGEAAACASGPADPDATRITATSMLPLVGVRGRVAAVLAGLGFTLDPAAREPDTWRSAPAEGWPAGIDYTPWSREAGPGFVVEVRLAERDGGTAITVAAQALCAPKWGSEDPRALELSLELGTAAAVLARLDPRARR
ncbi:MAG TPA: hypothetical protein VGR37_01455 [Longimicrobiaceae bacterium]|nr:hypothetical protein [Longimicrobiaceae bacterium]